MKKLVFLSVILTMLFSTVQLRAELSLEAMQTIEEMRNRLYPQKEDPETELIESESVDNRDYVVGAELSRALKRLRSVLYSSDNNDDYIHEIKTSTDSRQKKRISRKNRVSVDKPEDADLYNTVEVEKDEIKNEQDNEAADYKPGESLRKSLDKVKKSHESVDIHSFEMEVDSGFAAEPGHFEGGLRPKDFDEVDTAAISGSKPSPSTDDSSENNVEQSLKSAETEKNEKKNFEINRKLEKYEFHMPSNYRIIVR
ncbi:MAG: hypothetical protein ACQETH_02020 [Candidatus Rifleibacteriota bacterium]